MNEDPLIIALYCAIALYIGYIYRADIKYGENPPRLYWHNHFLDADD